MINGQLGYGSFFFNISVGAFIYYLHDKGTLNALRALYTEKITLSID